MKLSVPNRYYLGGCMKIFVTIFYFCTIKQFDLVL